jgi:D-alanyl-D-alanine carboxypeptidase/D-alanyl-D-alanine-endopeptidase (penicillin-binding protein 4)
LRRHRRLIPAALALLCVFTLGAGVTVVRLLPGRLALWQPPRVATAKLAGASQVLGTASGQPQGSAGVTAAGLTRAIGPMVSSPLFGPQLGVLVTNLATGQVLYSRDASAGFAPASTTKLATATAALTELGPSATFSTKVVTGASAPDIVLVGGGDPTLAAGNPPATDYPQPATLRELAARTATALRAAGRHKVHLGYDTSLYTGSGLAASWPSDYVSTGNVSVITPLEADQGRVTTSGAPADNEISNGPRSSDPAGLAAAVFAGYLRADGIAVSGSPAQTVASKGAQTLASVQSPPLSAIVQWMLEESNNVIAENLARQVALAGGQPASFAGAAAAEESVLHSLGVTGTIDLRDGSGLSPDDRIAPDVLLQLVKLAATRTGLRSVLTGLPVANFSGTLLNGGSVFGPGGAAARGMVRAKTGNLSDVAALAGVAYARNGQLLGFAIMADKIPASTGLVPAATEMTGLATVLAGCGCR